MSENIQTNWSSAYLQDNNDRILFDQDGNALSPQDSQVDLSRGRVYILTATVITPEEHVLMVVGISIMQLVQDLV